MTYFKKIMIANRGEIARRIIRTCKRLNISTVAVYSTADKDSLYVKEADEAYFIGESQVQKSYLNVRKILKVAKIAKVDAIHPGYGFLSENANFARLCKEEGIAFIGPSAEAIELMGSKIESRQIFKRAGVPVPPGSEGKVKSEAEALEIIEKIGFPVMLKASAGGGGIGMQLIRNEEELKKYFLEVKQKSSSFFGDDSVFIEKYIENARHIEVQILGDSYGNIIHLFERECSIQRRNQKVVEETPSPALDSGLKDRLLETAVRGVRELGYENAGTVEFIYDETEQEFYFLEMNTRLQVEHPITEAVTDIDIVEYQIRIAAKEKLDINQEDVKQNGYAIEVRLYAEDPRTFFPSPGTLNQFILPEQGVRLDIAVKEGDVITPFYDPMIGKITSHGADRNQAIDRMKTGLDTIRIDGIKTNLLLLKSILRNPSFTNGEYTTSFLNGFELPETEGVK